MVSAMVECFLVLQAVDTADRILKERGTDVIKLEGGSPSKIVAAKANVEAGIAVIGPMGFTPQAISVLGGFKPKEEMFSMLSRSLPHLFGN